MKNPLIYVDKLAGAWLDWRLDQAVKSDPQLRELHLHEIAISQSEYQAAFIGEGVAHLADMMSELLIRNKAENYVCFELVPRIDRGLRPIVVTVQWRNGKSPAQVRDEYAIENGRLKSALEKLFNECVAADADGELSQMVTGETLTTVCELLQERK